MKPSFTSSILAFAAIAVAAPTDERLEARAAPTVYLAGDSTMAKGGGGSQTEGISTNFLTSYSLN
jgi:rhamnogalacturonan acetylesterase